MTDLFLELKRRFEYNYKVIIVERKNIFSSVHRDVFKSKLYYYLIVFLDCMSIDWSFDYD